MLLQILQGEYNHGRPHEGGSRVSAYSPWKIKKIFFRYMGWGRNLTTFSRCVGLSLLSRIFRYGGPFYRLEAFLFLFFSMWGLFCYVCHNVGLFCYLFLYVVLFCHYGGPFLGIRDFCKLFF